MKKIFVFTAAMVIGFSVISQETCEKMVDLAASYLTPSSDEKGVFISDGQVYTAFFSGDDEEEAEFSASFYGGSKYRIAATAGSKDNYVIFEVRDIENNVLFTNAEFLNAPYWDFEVESNIDVNIIVKMDLSKKDGGGCATMLIGFKQ